MESSTSGLETDLLVSSIGAVLGDLGADFDGDLETGPLGEIEASPAGMESGPAGNLEEFDGFNFLSQPSHEQVVSFIDF